MTPKALDTLERNSSPIASQDNGEPVGSRFAHTINLYRHRGGKLYLREFGGAAMGVHNQPIYITRDEAIRFVATRATCVTGYGFSAEQAEIMVDGGDAGKGYRGLVNN